MYLFKKAARLQSYLKNQRHSHTIGFVPTMGALHEGHLSLIEEAQKAGDQVVCSIFVNPTQFNEQKDLDTYPRTPHKDISLLEKVGCDILFMPDAGQIYPEGTTTTFSMDFEGLDKTMEGAFRPGHFQGVAQVVKRLLDIVQPQNLFMGKKDFQQLAIIRHLINTLNLPVNLVPCATFREKDGLAMSSRNARLSEAARKAAPTIYEVLKKTKAQYGTTSIPDLEQQALAALNAVPLLKPEYFTIVDGHSLQPAEALPNSEYLVACVACWADDVRLIDNIRIKPNN